jgi:hypothetical protein
MQEFLPDLTTTTPAVADGVSIRSKSLGEACVPMRSSAAPQVAPKRACRPLPDFSGKFGKHPRRGAIHFVVEMFYTDSVDRSTLPLSL